MWPGIVAHADWSTAPGKRWLVKARLYRGVYRIDPPVMVRTPETLAEVCLAEADGRSAVLGFDFAIGLPRAYARRAGVADFRAALPSFGTGRWERFYELAEKSNEIGLGRPFYPARPGGAKQQHLVEGLGVESMTDLLRECELGGGNRNRACSLFWTLGGNQVGRAAIAGWRYVLVPAIERLGSEVALWPFDGALSELLAARSCVVTETYPADACVQLGLPAPGRGWSKRNQADRREMGHRLLEWAGDKPIDMTGLHAVVDDGFGSSAAGEDRFDAWVGLLGMLAVVLGLQSEGAPCDEEGRRVEGWILGQQS
jgi:hypothetical protein